MEGKKAKYIVVKMRTGGGGEWEEHLIPFGMGIVHKSMAENFGRGKVVSAGFIRFGDKKVECYGTSYSLGLSSRLEDEILAKITFGESSL